MYDPYAALGLTRGATDEEIKKAYRSLSRKYHPDANVNNPNKEQAEEKFKEIQQAYQGIPDMDRRAAVHTGILEIFSVDSGMNSPDKTGPRIPRVRTDRRRRTIFATVITVRH